MKVAAQSNRLTAWEWDGNWRVATFDEAVEFD